MTGILNLITTRLDRIDLTQPLAMLDLLIAGAFVISFLFYMRQFPVFRVIVGIVFLLACSVVFFVAGFPLTALVFGVVSNIILISMPLIFAPEIRHYLEKLGRFPFLKIPKITNKQKRDQFIITLLDAVYELANRQTGATIVIARKTGLLQTIETGVVIDAKFSAKLLQNLFFHKSPLHDGAVIVANGRIWAAGCLLPITSEVKLGSPFGTRHRSGLSITRDTDAVVIIVSEERGEVSLAENGKFMSNIDRPKLLASLQKLL